MTLQIAPVHAPATGPGTHDADEFQLPLTGLYADFELGAASLRLPDEFLDQPGLVQLKLLGAWQRGLARYHRAALERLGDELAQHAPGLGAAERLALLRRTCKSLCIELPDAASRHGKHA